MQDAPDQPTTGAPDDFVDAWETFFRAVRRARGRAARASGPGLTVAQFHLLEPLSRSAPLPVGALALEAGVSAPAATRMTEALERAGYVERRPDERDRRVALVSLTPAGKAALAERRRLVEATRRRIEAELPPEDRAQAAALLRRLSEIVEEQV